MILVCKNYDINAKVILFVTDAQQICICFAQSDIKLIPLTEQLGALIIKFEANSTIACVAVVSFPRAWEAREGTKAKRAKKKREGEG